MSATASFIFAKQLTARVYTVILRQRLEANPGRFKPGEPVGHKIGAPLPSPLMQKAAYCWKDHCTRPTFLFTNAPASKIKRLSTRVHMENFNYFFCTEHANWCRVFQKHAPSLPPHKKLKTEGILFL
jgi:hypothetical protein